MPPLTLKDTPPRRFFGVTLSCPIAIRRLWADLPLPIPNFTKDGILPTGIHSCVLNDVEARFVLNAQRRKIWSGFTSFLNLIAPIPDFRVMYIDGGFVTDNDLPKDVDIVLELPNFASLMQIIRMQPVLGKRGYIKSTYLVDLLYRFEPMPPGQNDLREFFQYVRPEDALRRGLAVGAKKGILRIGLR